MTNRIDAGSVIRRVFRIYRDRATALLPSAAIIFGATGALNAVLVSAGSLLIYVSFLLSAIATTLFTGMVVGVANNAEGDRRNGGSAAQLRAIRPVVVELILVATVSGIGIFVGFVLLLLPGLILATVWSVAAPVVVLERPGGIKALGRSRELVRGNAWQVFIVIVVMLFAVGLLVAGIDLAAQSAGTGWGVVTRVVLGALTAPIGALAAAVLYFDLRRISGPGPAEATARDSESG